MKLLFLFFLILTSVVISSVTVNAINADLSTRFVTARNYCDFLNAAALVDEDHLYDRKIESDPISACIVRSGKPSFYHYDVIVGRENFLISYTDLHNQSCYCDKMSAVDDAMARQASNSDDFLKSNGADFCVAVSARLPMLTLDWDHLMSDESTWDEWAPTLKGVIITASLCFSLYRIMSFCRAVPNETNVNLDNIRPNQIDTSLYNQPRPAIEANPRVNSPPSIASALNNNPKKIFTLEEFYNQNTGRSDPDNRTSSIKDFISSCTEANQIEQRLELAIQKINDLNKNFTEAKKTSLQAIYHYGFISGLTKIVAGGLGEIVLPGTSVIVHTISEIGGNGAVHLLLSEGTTLAVSETQSLAAGQIVNSLFTPSHPTPNSVTLEQLPENNLLTWSKWAAGQDLTTIVEGSQQMNLVSNELPIAYKIFLKEISLYERAMMDVMV